MTGPLVVVLAGGLGRRLGGDKPTTILAGRALIDYPLEVARASGIETVVVAKPTSRLPPLAVRVLLEPERPVHPLCGLVTALRSVPERAVLALGCDMPFLTAPLLRWLAGQAAPAVVAKLDTGVQPFPGLYAASTLPSLAATLDAERSLRSALEELQPVLVDAARLRAFGDPERICFSVNDAQNLAAAEHWLAKPRGTDS